MHRFPETDITGPMGCSLSETAILHLTEVLRFGRYASTGMTELARSWYVKKFANAGRMERNASGGCWVLPSSNPQNLPHCRSRGLTIVSRGVYLPTRSANDCADVGGHVRDRPLSTRRVAQP